MCNLCLPCQHRPLSYQYRYIFKPPTQTWPWFPKTGCPKQGCLVINRFQRKTVFTFVIFPQFWATVSIIYSPVTYWLKTNTLWYWSCLFSAFPHSLTIRFFFLQTEAIQRAGKMFIVHSLSIKPHMKGSQPSPSEKLTKYEMKDSQLYYSPEGKLDTCT